MIILGIDPGSRRIGYGLVKKTGPRTEFVAAGLLEVSVSKSDNDTDEHSALVQIKNELEKLIRRYQPEVMSVEKLFFAKNRKTGMAVSQARGVILLCAAQQGLEVLEYAPAQVKSSVGGYGKADKRAVAKMVRLFLNTPNLDIVDDATDALAIALTAAQHLRIK